MEIPRFDTPQEKAERALLELEALYLEKLRICNANARKVAEERDDARFQLEEAQVKYEQDKEEALKEMKNQFEEEKMKIKLEEEVLHDRFGQKTKALEEKIAIMQEDHLLEVTDLHQQVKKWRESRLGEEAFKKQRETIAILQRDLQTLQEELESQKRNFEAQLMHKGAEHKHHLKKYTEDLRAQRDKIEKELNEKIEECEELFDENDDLIRERNCLKHKLSEAQEAVAPLQRHIEEMKQEQGKYEGERLQTRDEIAEMKRFEGDAKSRLKSCLFALNQQQKENIAKEKVIKAFSTELFNLVHDREANLTNTESLRRGILDIYEKFIKDSAFEEQLLEQDLNHLDEATPQALIASRHPMKEFTRQRKALHRLASCRERDAKRFEERLKEQKRSSEVHLNMLLADNTSLRKKLKQLLQENDRMSKKLLKKANAVNEDAAKSTEGTERLSL